MVQYSNGIQTNQLKILQATLQHATLLVYKH